MKTNSMLVVGLSVFTFFNSSVLGQVNTPGWRYGRSTCGPVAVPPGKSLAACLACCNSPLAPLNPANVIQCSAYCAAVFPPVITVPSWINIFC